MEDFMAKDSKARKPLGKLLSFTPTGEYFFTKGLKAYHRRDFHKAKKNLIRAFQLEPTEPMIACQLAIVQTELGEYTESNTLLQQILEELDRDMVECYYFLANNYAYLGLFREAYRNITIYLEQEPEGEFADDAEDLLEVITVESDEFGNALDDDDLIIRQEEARELLEIGNFPKAVQQLQSIVEEYPDFWSAYNNLALAHFYLGEVTKAESLIEEVLEKNPGNLHALCNQLVFYFYQRQMDKTEALALSLQNVHPMLSEHQFKLGATFALVGQYELAYKWLKNLQKKGFDGDASFYYWLSHSAYQTGNQITAQNAWKRVLDLAPEKKGAEPWSNQVQNVYFEEEMSLIFLKLTSEFVEERLFGLFLTAISKHKKEIVGSDVFAKALEHSEIERQYGTVILNKTGKNLTTFENAHKIALMFYKKVKPISIYETGLYLMWFTVFVQAHQDNKKFDNINAWTAAVHYSWNKLRQERLTQKEVSTLYKVSPSTIQKYLKIISDYLL